MRLLHPDPVAGLLGLRLDADIDALEPITPALTDLRRLAEHHMLVARSAW